MLKRAKCRLFHRGEFLHASRQGRGTLRCAKCGAGFLDLADAGVLRLGHEERWLSVRGLLRLERAAAEPGAWEAGTYRVVRGGRVVGDGADRRVIGGQTVKVVRMRPGGGR